MIKRVISLAAILMFAWFFWMMLSQWAPLTELNGVSANYVDRQADELGAMNLVTAIVVTYRGLDTLGEVTVLFLVASGIGALLRRKKGVTKNKVILKRPASELMKTSTSMLVPFMVMFGAYIFLNGHLSPGGGFQGGAVVASAVLYLFLAYPDYRLNHTALKLIESFSGAGYVLIGLFGIFLANGFLDTTFLPLGEFGKLLSAGAIPIIYTLIGLKVGTELAGIIGNLKGNMA